MAANDAALLGAARHGDQAAWDALVADYTNLVWSIARGFRLETADAHDAVQMTWLRLVENLHRIRSGWRVGCPPLRAANACSCCASPDENARRATTRCSTSPTPAPQLTRPCCWANGTGR